MVLSDIFFNNKAINKAYFQDSLILNKPTEPSPVLNGLVCWLDGRDGKGTETTWKDRSRNGNNATLTNFNFDNKSGWTGKGLKFDGVDDFLKTSAIAYEILSKNRYSILINVASFSDTKEIIYFGNPEAGGIVINNMGSATGDSIRFGLYSSSGYTFTSNSAFVSDGITPNIFGVSVNGENILFGSSKETKEERLPLLAVIGADSFSSFSNISCGDKPFMNPKRGIVYSIKLYNRALTPAEIKQNYEYEQSIDRNIPMLLPEMEEVESYGIGLSNQLTEEQLNSFRLSVDKTQFVAGLRYCERLEVEKYTYKEALEIMETAEWKHEHEEIEV